MESPASRLSRALRRTKGYRERHWLSIAEYAKVSPCAGSHGEDLRFEIVRVLKRSAIDPCDYIASLDSRARRRAASQRLLKNRAMGYGHT